MVKAEAACITCPSVMLPSRNFGAHNSSGTTGAIRLDPCDTSVVRMCWPASRAHCRSTLVKVLSMPSRSSSSPPSSAMLSPFSRTRVSV